MHKQLLWGPHQYLKIFSVAKKSKIKKPTSDVSIPDVVLWLIPVILRPIITLVVNRGPANKWNKYFFHPQKQNYTDPNLAKLA